MVDTSGENVEALARVFDPACPDRMVPQTDRDEFGRLVADTFRALVAERDTLLVHKREMSEDLDAYANKEEALLAERDAALAKLATRRTPATDGPWYCTGCGKREGERHEEDCPILLAGPVGSRNMEKLTRVPPEATP